MVCTICLGFAAPGTGTSSRSTHRSPQCLLNQLLNGKACFDCKYPFSTCVCPRYTLQLVALFSVVKGVRLSAKDAREFYHLTDERFSVGERQFGQITLWVPPHLAGEGPFCVIHMEDSVFLYELHRPPIQAPPPLSFFPRVWATLVEALHDACDTTPFVAPLVAVPLPEDKEVLQRILMTPVFSTPVPAGSSALPATQTTPLLPVSPVNQSVFPAVPQMTTASSVPIAPVQMAFPYHGVSYPYGPANSGMLL